MFCFLILNAGVKCKSSWKTQNLHKLKLLRCLTTHEKITEKEKEETKPPIPAYEPSLVEANQYDLWESKNYFKPTKSELESFVVLLPPPNITGTLHLGHALTSTIQDIVLRWKRMKGESVLWIPGIDHAGIATQSAVEKYIRQSSGLSRHDLGKEKFIDTVWQWKNEKSERIIQQLRRIGASLDWSKLLFTLDSSHSQLVSNSFIQLYNDGLIYRKESLVNWSCALMSSISDIEVDWITIEKKTDLYVPGYDKPIGFGYLYDFAYKVCDEDEEVVVSTTRPETILGDVAVAIHPTHPSISKLQNKFLWHPFRNEKIPIIVDEFVNPEFGTGAVKITPSHSVTDFEIGKKHKLKSINVINEAGFINKIGVNENFHGLKRFDARWAVIKELKNLNLYRGSKSHSMTLPVCSRSGDVIEFLSKEQWFLKCDTLVQKAVDAVRNGDLKIKPESYKNVWFEWLENKPARDWNLSRQLWWGHQIPMYKCQYKDETIWVPGLSLEEAKTKASERFDRPVNEITIVQDPDVLDTWFSSGLLSLNSVIDQKRKPPISLMVTGHDILFFWLARMVMLSIQLTGELPFKQVFLHSLLCDANGKKMSKSLGNVIHPDDVINGVSASEMENRLKNSLEEGQMTKENFKNALSSQKKKFAKGIPECGVDALRFTLASINIQGFFANFDAEICLSNKHFGNKMCQAMNYFYKITDLYREQVKEFDLRDLKSNGAKLNFFDLWILSRLANAVECVNSNLATYRFDIAADVLRVFIINEFCNFYLTSTKSILENCSGDQFRTTISVFFHSMETYLRLLSPFMPFITDYLYQAMPLLNGYNKCESITVASYPNAADWIEYRNEELETRIQKLSDLLTALRRTKITFNLKKEKPKVFIKCSDELAEMVFGEMQYVIARMAEVENLTRVDNLDRMNVIWHEIDEDCTALVEHNYDKADLMKLIGPAMNKEKDLQKSLDNLLKTTNPEQKMTSSEKYAHSKKLNTLNSEIKKIRDFKFTLEKCER